MENEGRLVGKATSEKSAFNRQRLSELTRLVQGDRTVVQFSHDTGLNRGLIGMIINRKLDNPPSQRSIYRMMSSAAKPQGGVNLNEMLCAAGYAPEAEEGGHTVIPLQLSDLVLASHTSSPSRPLTIFMDFLLEAGMETNMDIQYHGGWFEVTGIDTKNRYVGINAFREKDSDLEITKLFLKANLLDTLSTAKQVQGLTAKAYYILTNDQAVYDFAQSLPRLGAGSMSVLLADNELTAFIDGAAIGAGDEKGSKSVDRILLKVSSKI